MDKGRASLLGWLRFQRAMGTRFIPAQVSEALEAALSAGGAGVTTPQWNRYSSMAELKTSAASCTACSRHLVRQEVVLGEGPVEARVAVVVGPPCPAPGGRAEVVSGPARQLLSRMLQAIGLELSGVLLIPAVKCRTGNVAPPGGAEIESCSPLLRAQLRLAAPSVLLIMGEVAAASLFGAGARLEGLRGRVHGVEGCRAVVTHDPVEIAGASPGEQVRLKREAWQDLQLFQGRCLP